MSLVYLFEDSITINSCDTYQIYINNSHKQKVWSFPWQLANFSYLSESAKEPVL